MATSTRLNHTLTFAIWLIACLFMGGLSYFFISNSEKEALYHQSRALNLLVDVSIRSNLDLIKNEEYRKFIERLNSNNKNLSFTAFRLDSHVKNELFSFQKNKVVGSLCINRKYSHKASDYELVFCEKKENKMFLSYLVLGTTLTFLILYLWALFIIDRRRLNIAIEVLQKFGIQIPKDSSVNVIFNELNQLHQIVSNANETLIKEKVLTEKSLTIKQIAHDIRSPLEALKSITSNINSLDYRNKLVLTNSIGRISDIANGLLRSAKENKEVESVGCLGILLDDLVSDKLYERDFEIDYSSDLIYSKTYVLGNESQLYRSFSNLINNAIEAQNSQSKIKITLTEMGNDLLLKIQDFGSGMSQETIEKVLSGGFTTKKTGNGLGLSYAKKVIESHSGELEINSKINDGTTIKIKLPRVSAPEWLEDNVIVPEDTKTVICLDDDQSFLQLYVEKLNDLNVNVQTFKSFDGIMQISKKDTHYFIDYDLGTSQTGLDFILKNDLANCSVLITSMHQDEEIQKKCIDNGIKILPKQMFNKAKVVKTEKTMKMDKVKSVVLIDDDELMHMTWRMEAEKSDIRLSTFKSVAEFLDVASDFTKDSLIYVDSNLSDGLKGEIESEKIAKLGFTEIHLATGYSSDDIDKPEWIKSIVGKRPKFN